MTYQPSSNDNQDYALPSHFFDNEATQIAQPVKPLTAAVIPQKGTPKPARRSWMFGAIAVSALVGSLVTVAAVSFYQRRGNNAPLNQQATTPAAIVAPTPDLAAVPSPSPQTLPANVAVSLDENDGLETSPSPESTASSRPTLTEARRTENTDNSNAANDAIKNAKDGGDTARRTTTTATTAEKQPKRDESVAADKNAEREAEERRAAERATAERLAAERAAARREEAKRSDNEDEGERRPRKVGKRGDDADDGNEEPVAPPQKRYADSIRRVLEGERPRRQQRRNSQDGTSERVRGIFEGQPPR